MLEMDRRNRPYPGNTWSTLPLLGPMIMAILSFYEIIAAVVLLIICATTIIAGSLILLISVVIFTSKNIADTILNKIIS